MATETSTKPVDDSIAKVNDDIAVGEDLQFQRRWWKFEKAVWIFLALLVILDLIGIFGRGPLSKARTQTPDGALAMNYEWVERFGTPSLITLHFGPSAVRDGAIRVWVSDSVITALGNQRISPQPSTSVTGDGGVAYTFPSSPKPNSVAFALEPSALGRSRFTVRLLGSGTVDHPQDALTAHVFVMP